jgi:hypothetical protein
MVPKLVPDAIRINARPELRLRSGDFVSIRIIKRIAGTKYAVALRGRVIPAFSRLDLVPGKTLNVLVSRAGDRFELRVAEEKPNHLLELLRREGLGTDGSTTAIVAAMLKTGLAVRSSTLNRIALILRRLKLEPGRFSRLIALIIDKKLDLSEAGLEKLVALLSYGEGGGDETGEERRRRRKYEQPGRREQLAELLRAAVGREEQEQGNLLQLFNHLKGSRESWIIVPYGFTYRDDSSPGSRRGFALRGTLRLRYEALSRTLNRLVLTAVVDGRRWSFLLDAEHEPLRLTVFTSVADPGLKVPGGSKVWQNLKTNLQNLGVEVDDTIREDSGFDGFSLPWEDIPYQSVNTQG